MRRTCGGVTTGLAMAGISLALTAAPAKAQGPSIDDVRIVVRDTVKEVIRSAEAMRTARAYQGRSGPEQTERFSRKVRIARDGRVSISNISGDIVVSAGSGDEVSIEAVKHTRGGASELQSVHIEVTERGGGVDVRTDHTARNDRAWVDYTVTMPAGASITAHSVSGSVKVTGIRGSARVESVSGNVTAADTPKLEAAKSVSGSVTVSGVSTDGELAASSVSGNVAARSIKVRSLDLGSVSGDVTITDAACDRLSVKSTSGDVEYSGSINRGGTYEINAHSGDVRLTLSNPAGFVLTASSFSGSVRSDLPLTIGGDARDRDNRRGVGRHSMRATYGDGSATLNVRTFSGDIIVAKR